MSDQDLRALALIRMYEGRDYPKVLLKPEHFQPPLAVETLRRIVRDLKEMRLADSAAFVHGGVMTRITPQGVDAIEKQGATTTLPINFSVIQNMNVSNSTGVIVGNNNSQIINIGVVQPEHLEKIKVVIRHLEAALGKLQLPHEKQAEANAEIQTIMLRLSLRNQKRELLRARSTA
jgi:hypothetical protein